LNISSFSNLDEIKFNALTSLDSLNISNNDSLTGISFNALTEVTSSFDIIDNTSLVNIYIPSLTSYTSETVAPNFSNNALSQETVDNILYVFDNITSNSGTLSLNGGTNAVPTNGANNVNKLSLEAKGWTVNINS